MSVKKRTLLRSGIVLVALGVFGWKYLMQPRTAPHGDDAPQASSAPAPFRKQMRDSLTLGTLAFRACELKRANSGATTSAYCTTFAVPENRADPHSRKIDLKLAILASDSQSVDPDLVVLLAGGPGEAATEAWPANAGAYAPLRQHHDLLLLDQRGTGGSHALSCPATEKSMQKSEAQAFDPDRVKSLTAQCLAEVEKTADPRFYTTSDAVADLEAVRRALGSPRLDLVGVSYGTRMAQQYAGAHSDAVRSIVLDSVVPNQLVLGEDFADNLERALKLQSQACMAQPACKAAFGDPYAALHALRDKLRAQPAQARFPDPVTFAPIDKPVTADALAGVVRIFSYDAEAAAVLPLAISEAGKGNFAPLMGQSQLLTGDLSADMNGGMQLSVICSEDAALLATRPQDKDTILGSEIIDAIRAECSVWPHGTMPKNFHAPFVSSIPTLILSGERDPVTPPRYAQEVLKGLSDGRVLEAKGMGHSVMARGCLPDLVNHFVTDLDPKELDAKCLDRIGPVPAYVNFNGASP